MMELGDAFTAALALIVNFEQSLAEIVMLSLQVSLIAVALACVIGLPIGAALAIFKFPGRIVVTVILNAMMGLPPVVVGLIVYLILSRSGPLGTLGLLYTPTAMIIAQICLITPIIAALTRQTTEGLWDEYSEHLKSIGIDILTTNISNNINHSKCKNNFKNIMEYINYLYSIYGARVCYKDLNNHIKIYIPGFGGDIEKFKDNVDELINLGYKYTENHFKNLRHIDSETVSNED